MNRRALPLAGVIAAVLIVYREAHLSYFFEDDFPFLAQTMVFEPWRVLDPSGKNHLYRPIVELYYGAASILFNQSPVLLHIMSVALHAANGVMLFLLARTLSGSERFAFIAALFFVVLPGYVDAVAWVAAVGEPLSTLFGLVAINVHLAFRRNGGPWRRWLAAAALTLAVLTHESAVVFLPLLLLCDVTAGGLSRPWDVTAWRGIVRDYAPYLAVVAIYLAIDVSIVMRSYLVREGYYRIGVHAVRHTLDYVVALFVGKRNLQSYALIVAVVLFIALRGTALARLGTAWMLIALLPFVWFTFGNVSRYLYLPAMGFALLLAEGVEWLNRALERRIQAPWRRAIAGLVIAAVAIRFMVFASEAVANFRDRTEAYRQFGQRIRAAHPTLEPGAHVPLDPADEERLQRRYVEALVRWQYRDPTIQLITNGR